MQTLNNLSLTILAFVLLATPALASSPTRGHSEQSGTETLFHDIDSGVYAAPVARVSKVGNSDGLFVGARGGWIINHDLVIGGAAYGLVSNYSLPNDRLTFAYGGGMIEYIIATDSLFHLSLDTVIGGGAVAPKTSTTPNGVFVVEPELDAIVNLSRSVRAGLGVSYRFTRGVHVARLSDSDLSGVNGTFMIQFGSF